MSLNERVLGLSISGNAMQAVEVELNGEHATLRAIDEWGTSFPEDNEFQKHLSAFIRVHRVKALKTAIAIDTSLLFIQRIPLEVSLPEPEVKGRVQWELHQYLPEATPNEFITDLITLAEHSEDGWNDILSVSIRRKHARILSKSLERMGEQLHVLDADHFSAQTALQVNYPESALQFVALTAVKDHRLDVSLIRNGVLLSYAYFAAASRKDIVERMGSFSREHEELHSIMLHGPSLDEDLVAQLREASTLPVEVLNPLRRLAVADSITPPDPPTLPPCRFASAIGVALRQD